MRPTHTSRCYAWASIAWLLTAALLSAQTAWAQLSTATVRGTVLTDSGPRAGVQVIATNVANGFGAHATSGDNGGYVLSGLAPGDYKIKVVAPGYSESSQVVTLLVGQSIALDLTLAKEAVKIDSIVVVGTSLVDTKTSE